jgi:tetratricopeptide (TPR) repeat protein
LRGETDAAWGEQIEVFSEMWENVRPGDLVRDLIAKTILDPAVEDIGRKFSDNLYVDARLREALALSYRVFGDRDQFASLQNQALENFRRSVGNNHRRTFNAEHNFGLSFFLNGQLELAEKHLRVAYEGKRQLLGPDDIDTLKSMSFLAAVLRNSPIESESLFREALERCEASFGKEDKETLMVMNSFGSFLRNSGRSAEAEPIFRQILERSKGDRSRSNQMELLAASNLGRVLLAQGKLEEAEPYLLQAVDDFTRLFGSEHQDTFNVMTSVANLYRLQNRQPEAEAYLRKAIKLSDRFDGKNSERWMNINFDLAMNLFYQQKKLDEAEDLLRQSADVSRKIRPLGHPKAPEVILNLAGLVSFRGQRDEALILFAEAESLVTPEWIAKYPLEYVNLLAATGFTYYMKGDMGSAERYLCRGLSRLDRHSGETAKLRFSRYFQVLIELYEERHQAEPDRGYDQEAEEWKEKLKELMESDSMDKNADGQ